MVSVLVAAGELLGSLVCAEVQSVGRARTEDDAGHAAPERACTLDGGDAGKGLADAGVGGGGGRGNDLHAGAHEVDGEHACVLGDAGGGASSHVDVVGDVVAEALVVEFVFEDSRHVRAQAVGGRRMLGLGLGLMLADARGGGQRRGSQAGWRWREKKRGRVRRRKGSTRAAARPWFGERNFRAACTGPGRIRTGLSAKGYRRLAAPAFAGHALDDSGRSAAPAFRPAAAAARARRGGAAPEVRGGKREAHAARSLYA